MKKIITICAALLMTASVWAQAPQKMSYQAVVRDAGNSLVANQAVGMQISILKGSPTGIAVYVETQTPTTNDNGLVSLEIGSGTTTGDFSTIDWGSDTYFIKTETDPTGGTAYTISGTSQLMSVPYALYAETSGGDTRTYAVGDFAQGGIVFWVDETGEHGLVCTKVDQSLGIQWYNGTETDTEAKGDGPYAGEMNTILIIANQGGDSDDYAAGICANLQITEGGKTYGDWYLPSKEELNQMYLNKSTINTTAAANGGSGFANTNYWSSREFGNGAAWVQYFDDGSQGYLYKGYPNSVRAVRAF